MALKKPQLERLHYLVRGHWANDWLDEKETKSAATRKYKKSLAEIESPEELHQLAWNHNWDDGIQFLEWMVEHPQCDKGTALLIFWLGEPAFHFRFSKRNEVSDWAFPTWKFLKKLSERYLEESFAHQKIKTDPSNIWQVNYLEKPRNEEGMGLYRIPYGLCVPSPGKPIRRLSLS